MRRDDSSGNSRGNASAVSVATLRRDMQMLIELSSCVGGGLGGASDRASSRLVVEQCKQWADEMHALLIEAIRIVFHTRPCIV